VSPTPRDRPEATLPRRSTVLAMPSIDRRAVRGIELGLAALVLAAPVAGAAGPLDPVPGWPTVEPVPVSPELVIPGLPGLAAVVGAVLDGIGVGAVVVCAGGALALWLAAASLSTLSVPSEGGVLFGGLFTVVAGDALGVAAAARHAAVAVVGRGGVDRRRDATGS